MSAGEEAIIVVPAAVVAAPIAVAGGVAAVGTAAAAVGVIAAVGAAAVAAGLAVGVGGAVVAAGAAVVGAVGYGVYKAGESVAESIRIAKENREQVKKATDKYLESLKADEAKGEEFVQKVLTYIEMSGLLYTKEEAEEIISQCHNVEERIDKAHELLELTSEYEMVIENLQTVLDMAKTLNLSIDEINDELSHIEQSKDDLTAIKDVLNNINDKIINWIREQEEKILEQAGQRVFNHDSWKIVSESRNVIATVCKDEIIELLEKSNDREMAEAKLRIEINDKRLALIRLYDALSTLSGFSLFEEEARQILSDSLVLFQVDHPELTDSGIDAQLDASLAQMYALYNRCCDMLGKELVKAKVAFEDALAINKAYRNEMRLPQESFIFDENDPVNSAEKVIKDNEELKLLYENSQKNKAWFNQIKKNFKDSGYIYVEGGREEMVIPGSNVIRVNEYFLTPDQECVVIVSTYSDGRPAEILVEGIKLHGFDTDKEHILQVQKKHCEKSAELLDGLVEGEIVRYEPSEDTAVAIEVDNLPDEYLTRALEARKKRQNKNADTAKKRQANE